MILDALTHGGTVVLVSMLVPLAPMAMGILYAIRPNEQRLAQMRPLSLAGIFSAIVGSVVSIANVLHGMALSGTPTFDQAAASGLSEALIPIFFGFGSLTVAWLCVAVGFKRHP
jgi:hypothetical protein